MKALVVAIWAVLTTAVLLTSLLLPDQALHRLLRRVTVQVMLRSRDTLALQGKKEDNGLLSVAFAITITHHGDGLILDGGCCGAKELIKLSSYLLQRYDLVLHSDTDTFFPGGSLYKLFAEKVYRGGNRAGGREKLLSLLYTTDPNMATHKGPGKLPVQGGFLLVRPSLSDYDKLISTIINTEFYAGSGWNRSLIGHFWGGKTIQGLLPYYYNVVAAPNRSLMLDRCVYNTMVDTKECYGTDGGDGNQIVSAHFTVCRKPWSCWVRNWRREGFKSNKALCGALHEKWFVLRQEAEIFYGFQQPEAACKTGGSYSRMNFDGLLTQSQDKPLRNLTEPLTFSSLASQATQYRSLYRPDLSPDVLHPRAVSGFSTVAHDDHGHRGER